VTHPALITRTKDQNYPILVIDKHGLIGSALADELKEDSLVVFVTSLKLDFSGNIIHIPYTKKFPTIPDNIYSHIFIIDETESFFKEVFHEFLDKSKEDKSDLITVFDLPSKDEELINRILDYKKAKVVLYGDVFGEKPINKSSYVDKFIQQIKSSGKIEMPNNGLRTIFPVYFEDLINGILETSFTTSDKERVINIFPRQGITLISLVRLFQKIDPTIRISFAKNEEEEDEVRVLENGIYILGDKYPLEEKLKKINLNIDRSYIEPSKETTKRPAGKNIRNKLQKLAFFIIILILILPLFNAYTFFYAGNFFLNGFENGVTKNITQNSPINLYLASSFFGLAKLTLPLFSVETQTIGQQDKAGRLQNKVDSGSNLSEMFLNILNITNNFIKGENINQSVNNLNKIIYIYQKERAQGNISLALSAKMDGLISFASQVENALPEIFSINGTKTYLVLFEDTNDLRPNGGLINAFGILKIQNGKVNNFSIHNVDEADGLSKLRIEPPFPLRRYELVTNWYLKDSSFDTDFSKSALASAMIFNSEENEKTDGVIALDLYFAKQALAYTGPIYVSDYNVTVNQNNLFQQMKAQTAVLKSNKNFVNAFYASLFKKLLSKNIPNLSLFNVFLKTINEKHFLFAFNDASIQNTFSANGFSSSLNETRPQSENLVNDFLGINEANLGGNEVGNAISRNVSLTTRIADDGKMSSTVIINYENSSQINENYKNYLRIILPKGSSITTIKINNQSQKIIAAITDPAVYENKKFVASLSLEVNKEDEQDKTVFGFLIDVPGGQRKIVEIGYNNSLVAPIISEQFTYNLRLFKQPGIDSYPLKVNVSYPSQFDFQILDDFAKQDGQAVHSETFIEDKDLNLILNKKS